MERDNVMYRVQVGAYREKENAETVLDKLQPEINFAYAIDSEYVHMDML